jgi:hypothetical protein
MVIVMMENVIVNRIFQERIATSQRMIVIVNKVNVLMVNVFARKDFQVQIAQ